MGIHRKVLYPVAISIILSASSAMAKLSPRSFIGVTEYFYNNKEQNINTTYYSPTLGAIALESGLLENLIFFGPFTPAFDKSGKREYAKDHSKNAHWNVGKILFPSSNGALGATFDADTNFAKYIKSPETIALLLNYIKQVEDAAVATNLTNVTRTFSTKIMKSLDFQGVGISTQETLKKKTVNRLLNGLREAIQDERGGTSFYPRHTAKQIVEAFFCYQFNKQEDIWELLEHLDDSIVDKVKLKASPPQNHYLELNDLPSIAEKPSLNLDDLFDLTHASTFLSPIPYKAEISLLNNGTTYFYDRAQDALIESKDFQDCAEMAMRHISNLLTFNALTREFDLGSIEKFVAEKVSQSGTENPYFANFKKFYEYQSPLMANAGDIDTRSLWNTVAGNLPETIYRREGSNEIASGFFNLLNTFNTLFSLALKPAPTTGLDAKTTWAKESLETLLAALNPKYTYTIDLQASEFGKELIGNALITVTDENTYNIFSFNLEVQDRHTEINTLKLLVKQGADYDNVIESNLHTFEKGTADESLLLLASPELQKGLSPLYQLYSQPLYDNERRIEFLAKLKNNFVSWKELPSFGESIQLIQSITTNVMSSLAWRDGAVFKTYVTNIIKALLPIPELTEVVKAETRSLVLPKENWEEVHAMIREFPNVRDLDLSHNENISTVSYTDDFINVKTINLYASSVENVKFDDVWDLEELSLFWTKKLKTVSLRNLRSLKKLKLGSSTIEALEFDNLESLEELDLNGAKNLNSFPLSPLKNLKKLDISNSKIEHLKLDSYENLENIDLHSSFIKDIALENLTNLQKINFRGSKIQRLFLKNLKQISDLEIWNLSKLQHVAFEGDFSMLESLSFKQLLNIESIEGLEHLTHLKTLDIGLTKNLNNFPLKKLNSLKKLNLTYSKSTDTGVTLDALENLEELRVEYSTFNSLSLENLDNLQKLEFYMSEIETLVLKNLKNIRDLNLESFQNLKHVVFEGDFSMLERLTFNNLQKLESIEGLKSLNHLKSLKISSTSMLTSLDLEGVNHDLEFSVQSSGLTRGSIRGFESLEERQIQGFRF